MKKTTVCLLTLITVGLIVTIGIASAFFGAGFISEENRLAIKQAIENNDFNAWKSAIIGTLTQENFDKLVERQKVVTQRKELQNAIRQAIEKGDYGAYKNAVENLMSSYKVMSKDDFNAMVQRYNATESRKGFSPLGGFDWSRRGFGRHIMPW